MKPIIVFILLLQSFVTMAQGGSSSLPPNTQCDGAERLCPSPKFDVGIDYDSTIITQNITTQYFYKFKAGTGSTLTNYIELQGQFLNSVTYTLYGPFSNEGNICDQLAQMTAPIVDSSNIPSTHQYLNTPLVAGSWYSLVVSVLAVPGSLNDGGFIFRPKPTIFACDSSTVEIPCEDCIPSFQPMSKQFILSAWVKEDLSSSTAVTTYANTRIVVTAGGSGPMSFSPTGQIIDGWQRIEGTFTGSNTGDISVELICSDGEAYFDDIRIFPFDGSMMSYVYDPITMRLMAELDERNYAKLYEYDEEGKLIRVKKETEKGIMTIQENRDNNSKQ